MLMMVSSPRLLYLVPGLVISPKCDVPSLIFSTRTIYSNDVAISVVGACNAGPAELEVASNVAKQLTNVGMTVVLGLA